MKKYYLYYSIFILLPLILIGTALSLLFTKTIPTTANIAITYYFFVIVLPIIFPQFIIYLIFSFPKILQKFSEIIGFIYLLNTSTFFITVTIFYVYFLNTHFDAWGASLVMKKSWTGLIFISFILNLSFTIVTAFFAKITFNSLKNRLPNN